jgi:hypothetical protein
MERWWFEPYISQDLLSLPQEPKSLKFPQLPATFLGLQNN